MAKLSSGKRYAQAIFELALEKGEFISRRQGLEKIAEIAKDEKLVALLDSPELPFNAKKGLLEERLEGVNPFVLDLALFLVDRGELRIVDHILQEYTRLLDTYNGIEHVEIVTALPLDEGDKERVSQRLEGITGCKVNVDFQIDPSIIGGIRAKIGDMLIDNSIRNRLDSLRKELSSAY